ncbi:MAG: bifunctional folylpolyglutamate synthase/dihydrofolate synthase [Campylobacterales bacterium]|nr:bifunctional folylpolyglutamate synthase/dihydrofolate synthase [Campylobacterales bacterium]
MGLQAFLGDKPLYYDVIDYDRFPRIYNTIRAAFAHGRIIHIVGTNGKGTTGRFIAHALHVSGFRVGHYTSPHILHFNERVWIDGADADDATLEAAHVWLLERLSPQDAEALSYFEYTTLLAMRCFDGCDYVVLEAGLGGEFDATNVFEKYYSVFTPIGIDHQAFLGETIEQIASTKLRSMGQRALIMHQSEEAVYALARGIADARGSTLECVAECASADGYAIVEALAHSEVSSAYLQRNLLGAITLLERLHVEVSPALFVGARLFGRLSKIAPNVWLDVGHNVMAAEALARHFAGERLVLVYNSYGDKDYRTILAHLKPVIKRVELIAVDSARIETDEKLHSALEALEIAYEPFVTCKRDELYLVFGSFSVAEAFLRRYES